MQEIRFALTGELVQDDSRCADSQLSAIGSYSRSQASGKRINSFQ